MKRDTRLLLLLIVLCLPWHVTGAFSRTKKSFNREPLDEPTEKLHAAARRGSAKRVQKALDAGAAINTLETDGFTPLMAAVLRGHDKVVKVLLDAEADVQKQTDEGFYPLDGAGFQGRPECVRLLVEAGADLEARAPDGYSALHRAIWGKRPRHLDALEAMLKAGGNANAAREDETEERLMHTAVHRNNAKALRLLLGYGAQVNGLDATLNTPLHIAADLGNEDMVWELLQAGAKWWMRNSEDKTPLDMGESHKNVMGVFDDFFRERRKAIASKHYMPKYDDHLPDGMGLLDQEDDGGDDGVAAAEAELAEAAAQDANADFDDDEFGVENEEEEELGEDRVHVDL